MFLMHELSWFTSAGQSHASRLVALSRFVYTGHLHEEVHRTQGPIMTFDNMCSGDLERAAGVLEASGFTKFIDDIGRRSVFVVGPDDFSVIAKSERAARVDSALVEEAAMCLVLPNHRPTLSLGQFFQRLST